MTSRSRTVLSLFILGLLLLSACQPAPGAPAPSPGQPQEKTLKVGMLLAMTGPGSFYGQVMSRGAQLAVDQLNKAGGVKGWKLQLVIEDHKSGDAEAGASGGRKLMEVDRVPVILSSYTAPTLAIQPIAVERKVLLFNGGGVGASLINKENLYNTRMLGSQLMPGLVQLLVQEKGVKRVATIFWNDAAGRSVNDSVKSACGRLGCQVVAEEPHDIGQTNYGPQIARIKAANPDAVVVGSYGNDVGYIVNQLRAQGVNVQIAGNEWTPDAQRIAGDAPMEGYVVALDRFDPTGQDPRTKEFVDAYRAAYGEVPEFYAANYYDLVYFVLRALIEQAVDAGKDPSQPGVLLDLMKQAAQSGKKFGTVYGGDMVINPDGTTTKPAGLFRVESGSLKLFARIVNGQVVKAQ